jgi:uncharacterized protein with ParB-like and HNH nuclease domain
MSDSKLTYENEVKEISFFEEKLKLVAYLDRYDNSQLILNPDFQRNQIWKADKKSLFIESILLGYPIAPFYLNQQKDGSWVVIDGLQRTSALLDFVHNDFKLKGLEQMKSMEGLDYVSLPLPLKAKFQEKKLLIYILKPSNPIEVVYDLFKRINTGGTKLEAQEIRNAILQGNSTKLLKELAENEIFITATSKGIDSKRMKDRELILRYFAFQVFDYQRDYHGNWGKFLEETMRKLNNLAEEEIQLLKTDFLRVMRQTSDFFGEDNFRLKNSKGKRSKINSAVFETVSFFFAKNTEVFLIQNKAKIIENFTMLIESKEYLNAVKSATNSKLKVYTRFELTQKILGNL